MRRAFEQKVRSRWVKPMSDDLFERPASAPDRGRRAVLGGLSCAGLALAVAGCGSIGSQLGSETLSVRQLDQLMGQVFPYTRGFAGLVDLSLQNPRLQLLPQANRLGTVLDLVAAERITGRRFSGSIDLDYGLRYDADQGAIRLADVRVKRLDVEQLAAPQRALVNQYAPRLVELLLSDAVLYRLSEQRLKLANQLGVGVTSLRVRDDGLHIEMGPGSAR